MKKLILAFTLIVLCGNLSNGQVFVSQTKTDAAGKEFTSYQTNNWLDDFYIGGGIGVSTRFTAGSYSDITKLYFNPTWNIYVLKWFTPSIGLRLGYQGGNGREGLNSYNPYQIEHSPFPYKINGEDGYCEKSALPGCLHYGTMHIHGDLMWNITNTFWKYNSERFFNLSLYFSGGYLRMFDNKTDDGGLFSKNCDNEFTLGLGIYTTFRFCKSLLGTADLRYMNNASRYRTQTGVRTNTPTLSLGIAYILPRAGKSGADVVAVPVVANVSSEEVEQAQKTAKEALAAAELMKKENEKLSETIDSLKSENVSKRDTVYYMSTLQSMSYDTLKDKAQKADLVLYCMINETNLNFSETLHLNDYVESILKEDPEHIFLVTGFADKGTGSSVRNLDLSKNRALNVKDILMKKFNVKESNIRVSNFVVDTHSDGALDRCVIIESANKQGY